MKVMRCSSNNLSIPSFGMQVDFDSGVMTAPDKGVNLPNYGVMREAIQLTNIDPEVRASRPGVAYLKYGSERTVSRRSLFGRVSEQVVDVWTLVTGGVSSREIEIPRVKPKLVKVEEQLLDAVRTVTDRYSFARMRRVIANASKTGITVVV